MRLITALLFSVCLPAALTAAVTDFQLTALPGPHHVVQGHFLTFNVNAAVTAGTDDTDGTVPSVTGIPPGSSADFLTLARYCCKTFIYRVGGELPLRVTTTAATPLGTYTLQVSYTTKAGLVRTTPYLITVDPMPTMLPVIPVTSTPRLTGYKEWKENASIYGKKHCNAAETKVFSEPSVTYYDGARVYYQIADLTGDHSFDACANMIYSSYAKYVNANRGKIPGYHVFGEGFKMTFLRTGDQTAKKALETLVSGSLYANWPDPTSLVHASLSREMSYAIEANLLDQSLGSPANPHFQDLVETLLGHFDQWFISKTVPVVQPFMVALGAEALIAYWDVTKDPRVPPMLQTAADQVWTKSWNRSCSCFNYYNDDGTLAAASQDLNLLIAPMYGWIFKQTGNIIYRDHGDRAFNAGVTGAWIDGGKQFSQSYRWSGKYVEWRQEPATSCQGTVQSQAGRSDKRRPPCK
jgi:hypothetical protein